MMRWMPFMCHVFIIATVIFLYHPRPVMACTIVCSLPAIHVLGIFIPHARMEVGGDTGKGSFCRW